jgi:hypothetical protein
MKATNNPAIDQFIIEVALIEPIEKIINLLDNRELRDCDIKWLDKKLENFIEFAAKTLGITAIMPSQRERFTVLNNYVRNQYKKKFCTLLNYFKTL